MLGIHDYGLFIASGVLLALAPGQDTMYIIGRSLTGGLRSGVASALGINVGCIIHTLMAAAGLSILLASSPAAFTAVKLCGAAYLVFLGGRLLLAKRGTAAGPELDTAPARWCLIPAAGAARLRGFFARNPRARGGIDRATGGLFILMGARLAWSR